MLKTLSSALDILKMFTREKPEWGGRELATHLQENYTKIYRILETLVNHNFLAKDPHTKKYSLGYAILELGMIKNEGINVKQVINPILEKLSIETDESVFLTVLDKDQARILDAVETKNTVKFSVTIGSTAPLYAGASYRSILAFMPEDFIEAILVPENLHKFTEHTITNPDELKAELQKIRDQGWAISQGEHSKDVMAIAVPLFIKNKIIGSLTVSGPIYRITDEKIKTFLDELLKAKDEVEEIGEKYQLTFHI
jgi:DNA-binding IclR family transcriptional regulator